MTENSQASLQPSAPVRRGFFARLFGFITVLLLFVLLLAVVYGTVGFARYTWTVTQYKDFELDGPKDGIVVLTGGRDRISKGFELLIQKKAKRLLVSGVNPATTKQKLKQITGQESPVIDCCVDTGHAALDTVGNAIEVASWASSNGYTSLIMVTSDYHMPRALQELDKTLSDVSVTPFPVISPNLREPQWYRKPQSWKLLFSEFTKLQASKFSELLNQAKLKVDGWVAKPEKPLG